MLGDRTVCVVCLSGDSSGFPRIWSEELTFVHKALWSFRLTVPGLLKARCQVSTSLLYLQLHSTRVYEVLASLTSAMQRMKSEHKPLWVGTAAYSAILKISSFMQVPIKNLRSLILKKYWLLCLCKWNIQTTVQISLFKIWGYHTFNMLFRATQAFWLLFLYCPM